MTMISSSNNNGNGIGIGGDTTLTKVFVGGLAWETPKEAMKEHFQKFGEILEAVIISDKLTGRSKGYGFVTFKDAEAAKKACEDATPIINGRRANCNLAALGARRPRSNSSAAAATNPPPQQGVNVGPRAAAAAASTPPPNHVQWYYPARTPPPPAPAGAPFHQHHHQAVPFYGYSPTYIATTDMNYNHKMGGSYMNGHFGQLYPSQAMVGASTLMPVYPFYHYHQSHTMGLPAHMYSPTATGPIPTLPAIISKPTSIAPPNAVCLAVE